MAEVGKKQTGTLTICVQPTKPPVGSHYQFRLPVQVSSRDGRTKRESWTGHDSCARFTDLPFDFYEVQVMMGGAPVSMPKRDGEVQLKEEQPDITRTIAVPVSLAVSLALADGTPTTTLELGSLALLRATYDGAPPALERIEGPVTLTGGLRDDGKTLEQAIIARDMGHQSVSAVFRLDSESAVTVTTAMMVRNPPPSHVTGDVSVHMQRTASKFTSDVWLWLIIRRSTEALSFDNYDRFLRLLMCGPADALQRNEHRITEYKRLARARFLPYTDADAYRLLKVATEAFVMVNCGVNLDRYTFTDADREELHDTIGDEPGQSRIWERYLEAVNGCKDLTLPYLRLVYKNLGDVPLKHRLPLELDRLPPEDGDNCWGVLRDKLTAPCFIELIWSYWHEEGMLVQTINAITRRFQNVRMAGRNPDPLANFEINPLRPLANLLWAYSRDEMHRLSVVRRNYEYNHEYGLRLEGRAVANMQPADSRSSFLEAFHHLLLTAAEFHKRDDDTTVMADGFPVLNALKEVHLILAEGAHNQFGDLPSTARIEMLMEQWLLARAELENFLPTRAMVAYPERWMDRVDAMKRLQGWPETNVLNFHNLAKFGERLLLSIRYGNWTSIDDAANGANWARLWRPEIQGYIHAYRAVAGVDLTSTSEDPRARAMLPSTLLRRRLAEQSQRLRLR